jgi:hypothetical protein
MELQLPPAWLASIRPEALDEIDKFEPPFAKLQPVTLNCLGLYPPSKKGAMAMGSGVRGE